jgi:VIT1/CCC1 family predicted Fe2+/Mn2+ transporter
MATPPDDRDWDPTSSAHRRMLRIHANDGLIAAAGIIQGLSSAGATGAEATVAAVATMVVGGLLVFGAEFGEAASERDSQLAIVEAERLRLEMSPQEEFDELVEIYRAKGLSGRVAHEVAQELSDKDALAAQLDAEYGISDLGAIVRPVRVGAWCAAAFVVGSVIPLPFLTIVPVLTREIALFVIVAVALTASAVIGARSDRTSALQAVTRTLGIGLGTMGISLFAGSLLSF